MPWDPKENLAESVSFWLGSDSVSPPPGSLPHPTASTPPGSMGHGATRAGPGALTGKDPHSWRVPTKWAGTLGETSACYWKDARKPWDHEEDKSGDKTWQSPYHSSPSTAPTEA